MDWQPVNENTPRDTEILVWRRGFNVTIAELAEPDPIQSSEWYTPEGRILDPRPTKWQPLPSPPKERYHQ